MNCVLTNKQQRLLFGKIGIDLKNMPVLDFNTYAKEFYDLINNKTNDSVLAANYVALLPMNIRAVMGVNRDIFRKLATTAGRIADLEAQFENFDNVQDFVGGFQTENTDMVNLEKDIQKQSLTELPEPITIIPNNVTTPSISLWDLNFDVTKEGELKPEMALYTNVKKQLIANRKDDGTSIVDGKPVKMQVVSTANWEAKDFYPDVERKVLAGDQTQIGYNKKGIVLLVTDMQGNPVYFDSEQKIATEGKPAYYIFKASKKVESGAYVFDFNEKAYVEQLKRQRGLTQEQAESLLNKQNEVFAKIRETILTDPNVKTDVWITGGFSNIVLKPTPQQLTIGNVFDFQGKAFKPYKGPEGKENLYFFDYPGYGGNFIINKPKVPDTIITKLVQLLSQDVINRNGTPVRITDKIAIFKQFIHIDPAILSLRENAQGGLEVQKLGRIVTYPSKEALSQDLMDIMRNNILTRELSATQLSDKLKKGSQIVPVIKGALSGSIFQYQDGDKLRSFEIGPLQLKIDKIAADTNKMRDFNLTSRDDKFIFTNIERSYYPFIQENFLIDAKQYPKTAGETLEFALAPEPTVELIKKEVKSEPIAPLFDDAGNLNEEVYSKKTPEKISGINDAPIGDPKDWLLAIPAGELFKRTGQENIEATQEQIAAAKVWYKNNPLSQYFGFEPMFSVVNKKGSNNIATWTTSGITLFKGADYSDLYHEAWHGFTQAFLTKAEKTDLYNESRKKSGTFIDYVGNNVKFSDATDLQIEEYLAEDFREYMLSDGKKVLKTSPVRNTIFRRILNFLKELFGSANVKQTVIDEQVTQKISQLYQKLRVGDLSSYSFAASNRNFDTLNKALQSINPGEVEKSLSFENSNVIYNAVNSLFSEAIDTLNANNTMFNYTTAMLSTTKGIKTLYTYAKAQLSKKLAELSTIENPTPDVQNQIDLLSYAIRNFGNIDALYDNRAEEGVVGYHLFKTDLIEQEVFDEIAEDEENAQRELEGKEYFDRGGNERSPFELASREVTNILKSLYQTDQNGVVQKDIFGFPKLLNHKAAFSYILRLLENSKDLPTMYSRLQADSDNYHPIKQLLTKMGPVYTPNQTARETDLWSKFFQTFNKYRQPLVQTTVNKTVEYDQNTGKVIGTPTYDIKIGNALADTNKTDQDWRSQFSKENTNPFIKNDEKGNWLDTKSLLETYPTITETNADPMKFLKDIGIIMADIPVVKSELDKSIKSGSIRLSGIYNNITKLNEGGIIIRNIGTYLTANPKLGIKGLVGQTGPNSNYGKLLALQTKYSSDYSDFMVQNAAGDPQSEYSLNSSLTQIVKQINSVSSYVELVNSAPTAQYNNTKGSAGRPYNPFINASVWFNALFDMQSIGGQKRDNELTVDNLSGINSRVNDGVFKEGVALAQSDAIGKLLNDFHVQLMKFTPELTRHAGKKTSLTVYLRNYYTGAKNKRLYIDTEDFVTQDQISAGQEKFQQQLIKYIGAELDRVNYAKELLEDDSVTYTDFAYLKRASKFVAFDGVLSESSKQQLYTIQGNLTDYLNSDAGIDLDNQIRGDILSYFNGLVDGVQDKMNDIGFTSQALIDRTRVDAQKAGVNEVILTDSNIQKALSSSFIANNWLHHFEEMITFYGDIALYKDFFKRNASLNSTGDIIRNDEDFIKTVNEKLGRGFTQQLGITMEERPYTGIVQTAIVSDVLVKSVYYDRYKSAVKSPNIDEKYGDKGVNEADAQGLVTFDFYRIILKGLGKWTLTQEQVYQDLLAGKPAEDINVDEIFPVLKMGYYGPIQSDYLPLTGLHKFALFPLIPGVIRSNLQELHAKMMREGIDYVTFESGSKVATITDRSGHQPLYSDQTNRVLSTEPFVKNTVFPEYLKYQVEAAPYYKGKITLATQLRKLADIGLTEEGVPTDYAGDARFKDRESAWESLNETQKKSASKNYTLRANYLKSIVDLEEEYKKKLLKDVGNGNTEDLLRLISDELKRGDVGDHEWAFIQTIKGNEIKNDLDISTSADMIEKVIISLVNKRLINLKVRGEQLVLVSGTGFEDKAFAYQADRNFEKPTKEDLETYGTNDLPGYYIGDNGLIQPAKVKIALQGNFKKLLQHPDVRDKSQTLNISNFQALNLLIKDKDWVSQGDNRYLISMVGARIPTQGINSAEFVEVYEFLPEIAGNIIIAPSEITSKGGSDFDYDKLPLMMPSFSLVDGDVVLTVKSKEGDNTNAIENDMIKSLRSILEQPGNFEALITPNDTNLVKPYADEIYKAENGSDAKTKDKQGTRMFEPLHNIKVQQANSIGIDTLGVGMIYNSFNAVFKSIGFTLNKEYGSVKSPRRATLMFPHNTKNGNISLSSLKDAEDVNSISEVVSQLINGWVDVEKDDWISYIQGNKEIAPVMLFMLRAGVPIKDVVYFITQPLIKEYVKEQRIVKGAFAEALGFQRSQIKAPKRTARNEILVHNDFDLPFHPKLKDIYEETVRLVDKPFSTEELKKNLNSATITDLDRAVFLHFLEIENMSKEVDAVQRAFNVDTTRLQTLNDFYKKIYEIDTLESNSLIPKKYIQRLKDNTPIGPFYVQKFALDVFSKLLPLRTNELLNQRMLDLSDEVKALFKDEETAMKTFKDDLLNYVFQQEVRSFIGVKVDDTPEGEAIPSEYFSNNEERRDFNNEVRKLRSQYNPTQSKGDLDYEELLVENTRNDSNKGLSPQDLELLTYEQWLNEKALYNILNPHQLFKSRFGIVGKYSFIVNKYPQLKQNFSLLANIKTSTKEGISNLQLSSMKLSKDEIDIFHENFKDLSNSAKLVEIQGIIQKDADYISEFFGNLPLYLYMQSGPNTRSPFSFNRVMPNDKILRILEEPVRKLTASLDEEYLNKYTQSFFLANSNTSTRSRFKDYLAPDIKEGENDAVIINEEIEEKPTNMEQLELFETDQALELPFDNVTTMSEVVNHSGGALGADTEWDEIGKEFGMTDNRHYWMNNKTPKGNIEITEADRIGGQKKVTEAARQMGRIDSTHQVRDERLIRNWSQVKYADAVFAITTLLSEGSEMNYGKKTKIVQGKGGTGYAVQMAINEDKPVYLFDQVRNQWYSNIGGVWTKSEVPVLTRNFAGVGTREINEVGKQAIRDVYEKTVNKMSPEVTPKIISDSELNDAMNCLPKK